MDFSNKQFFKIRGSLGQATLSIFSIGQVQVFSIGQKVLDPIFPPSTPCRPSSRPARDRSPRRRGRDRLCWIMLLYYIMLYCIVYVVQYSVVYTATDHYSVVQYSIIYYIVQNTQCSIVQYVISRPRERERERQIMLYRIISYWIMFLYPFISYCIGLCWTILYYIILYQSILAPRAPTFAPMHMPQTGLRRKFCEPGF